MVSPSFIVLFSKNEKEGENNEREKTYREIVRKTAATVEATFQARKSARENLESRENSFACR